MASEMMEMSRVDELSDSGAETALPPSAPSKLPPKQIQAEGKNNREKRSAKPKEKGKAKRKGKAKAKATAKAGSAAAKKRTTPKKLKKKAKKSGSRKPAASSWCGETGTTAVHKKPATEGTKAAKH